VRLAAVSFAGRNGAGVVELALPEQVRIAEGAHTRYLVQLIVDGVDLDAELERSRDVTELGSPVKAVTTYRDPRVANRVIVRVDLLTPCSTSLRRTAEGARWQIVEEAAW
jgi:hypothetical protein